MSSSGHVLGWETLNSLIHVFIVVTFNCELIYCCKVCRLPCFLLKLFNFRLFAMFLSVNNRCTKGKLSRTTGSESAFILVSQWVIHRVVINKLTLIAGGDAPTIGIWCRFDSRIYLRHTFLLFISSAVQDLVIINNYDIPTIGSHAVSASNKN